jgi:hypothetical protein
VSKDDGMSLTRLQKESNPADEMLRLQRCIAELTADDHSASLENARLNERLTKWEPDPDAPPRNSDSKSNRDASDEAAFTSDAASIVRRA